MKRNFSYVAMAAGISGLVFGCNRTSMVALDSIVEQGQKSDLVAYVHNSSMTIFSEGVPQKPVQFYVEDREIGETKTDPTGKAQIPLEAVKNYGVRYCVRLKNNDQSLESVGWIFVWDPNRTAVAIDLDETICVSKYLNLIWGDGMESQPLPGAAEAIQTLAKDYHIVYWSARPHYMVERTRNWLAKNDFPPGPIVFTEDNWGCFKQADVKKQLLTELRKKWPNVRIGIGDKYVDVDCCKSNEMLPVIVNAWQPTYKENSVVVPDWKTLGQFFDAHRDVLTNSQKLASVIERGEPLRVGETLRVTKSAAPTRTLAAAK